MPRPRSQRPASAFGGGFVPRAPPPAAAAAVGAALAADGGDGATRAVPGSPMVDAESEFLAYGHHSRVFDVALLQAASDDDDSYLLASAGEDEVVRVWQRRKKIDKDGDDLDRRTRTSTSTSTSASSSTDFDQLAVLRGHGEPVLRVAWGPPRSRLLASAGGDRAARIWKIEEGDGDGGGGGNGDENGSAPAPPPRRSRFSSSSPILRLRQAAVLPDHPEEVYACELTSDARCCVTASASRVFSWDLETGKRVNEGRGGEGGDLPLPQPMTNGGDGGNGLSSPSLPPRWAAAPVFSATLSPGEGGEGGGGGGLVAAACSDGCLRIWSLGQPGRGGGSASSASLSLFPLSAARAHATAPAAACCWSRDGTRIAVTGSRSGGVAVIDSRTMGVCWRGSVDDLASSSPSPSGGFGACSSSPPSSSSSAMGACFLQGGGGEFGRKELLAVATSRGRVALFDVNSSSSDSSSVAPPVSYLQARRVPPRRSMLCVATLPRGGGGSGGSCGSVLVASGDALADEGGGGGGGGGFGSDSRRASKWSPVSVWEG